MTQGLGILEFPAMSSPSLTGGSHQIAVIASEAKQSLGILNLSLGILDLCLEILDFCLEILDFCSL